ncbi:hypothetical protein KP509_28G059300 [Ceratopteris richardii]|uniref:Uncharacterized protein n=1 Tax=Ceratopteris richardii TaxID=49495 RepID=A0A8T2RE82_CERRI|nr:hypothetical protein KP509_28G059300 [Ceratopteris richardii]
MLRRKLLMGLTSLELLLFCCLHAEALKYENSPDRWELNQALCPTAFNAYC